MRSSLTHFLNNILTHMRQKCDSTVTQMQLLLSTLLLSEVRINYSDIIIVMIYPILWRVSSSIFLLFVLWWSLKISVMMTSKRSHKVTVASESQCDELNLQRFHHHCDCDTSDHLWGHPDHDISPSTDKQTLLLAGLVFQCFNSWKVCLRKKNCFSVTWLLAE